MRNAEARLTLGVVAARAGDLEQAISYGRQALQGDRKSLPSLLMCSKELATLLGERYPNEPGTLAYLDEVLSEPSARADFVATLVGAGSAWPTADARVGGSPLLVRMV